MSTKIDMVNSIIEWTKNGTIEWREGNWSDEYRANYKGVRYKVDKTYTASLIINNTTIENSYVDELFDLVEELMLGVVTISKDSKSPNTLSEKIINWFDNL